MKQYIILGAGISGLSLAWFLKKRFAKKIKLVLIEKEKRPGGWIQTVNQDGFLFEQGPRGCRPKGIAARETLKLIEELGIQNEVITANTTSRCRYIMMNKKLRALPTNPISFLTSPLGWSMIRGAFKDFFTPSSVGKDESISSFVSRRFGKTIADHLFDPLATGIYGGDISKLSIKSCFPTLAEWEYEHGSVIRGALSKKTATFASTTKFTYEIQKHPLFSFKKGMETLTKEIARQLDEEIRLSTSAIGLNIYPNRAEVKLSDGSVIEGDHLFSTLPAKEMAHLLSPHRSLADGLRTIPDVPIAVASLGYYQNVLKKKGYGYLVPSKENEEIMGMVWDSEIFPQQNRIPEETRLTVMLGGAHKPEIEYFSKEQIKDIACNVAEKHLGISSSPNSISIKIAKGAIPQYLVGHSDNIATLENAISTTFRNLTLFGNSYYGVAVNDCITKSRAIADQL